LAPAYAEEQLPSIDLSASQLFAFADEARDRGDFQTAETAYRALASNPDIELRTDNFDRVATEIGITWAF
jgi:hypothetical protein